MQNKITKRLIDDAQPAERDLFLWDTELKGFGVKITPAGYKVFIFQYRMGGRGVPSKRFTIGDYGTFTPDEARKEAEKLRGDVRKGIDPNLAKRKAIADRRSALSVECLCEEYLKSNPQKKPSTLAVDKGRISRHIIPLLGSKAVRDVTSADVRRFMLSIAEGKTKADIKTGKHGRAIVKGGKGTATRTVGLLGGIFSYAVAEGYRSDNPVRGVKRYSDQKAERFLSPAELKRLGDVLALSEKAWNTYTTTLADWQSNGQIDARPRIPNEAENPIALAAIRLLILTGCRKSELLTLKHEYIDLEQQCLNLSDSKTGAKRVPLGASALALLSALPRVEGNPYVFPGAVENRHLVGLQRIWMRVRSRAELVNVRLHDLRHSFASVSATAGASLVVIGKLLGHKDVKTTSRYAHLADDPLKAAVDQISGVIAQTMSDEVIPSAEIIRMPRLMLRHGFN